MGMSNVLRHGLLTERTVALAGAPADSVRDRLLALGARVEMVPPELDGFEEETVGEWARARAPLHALVYTAGAEDLDAELARAWGATRALTDAASVPCAAISCRNARSISGAAASRSRSIRPVVRSGRSACMA